MQYLKQQALSCAISLMKEYMLTDRPRDIQVDLSIILTVLIKEILSQHTKKKLYIIRLDDFLFRLMILDIRLMIKKFIPYLCPPTIWYPLERPLYHLRKPTIEKTDLSRDGEVIMYLTLYSFDNRHIAPFLCACSFPCGHFSLVHSWLE
jgi:hypothetical protein